MKRQHILTVDLISDRISIGIIDHLIYFYILGKKFNELSRTQSSTKPVTTAESKSMKKTTRAKPAPVEDVQTPAKTTVSDDEGEDDEIHAAEPKQRDPFVDMPKPKFNFDEFKRIYSNEDTISKAIPYFWNSFDKENCSIWLCEYKYSNELTQIFKSCNLIGGFFQRLDTLRKNAFASMCVFGENDNNTVAGLWVWRGQDLVFQAS